MHLPSINLGFAVNFVFWWDLHSNYLLKHLGFSLNLATGWICICCDDKHNKQSFKKKKKKLRNCTKVKTKNSQYPISIQHLGVCCFDGLFLCRRCEWHQNIYLKTTFHIYRWFIDCKNYLSHFFSLASRKFWESMEIKVLIV